MTQYGIGSYPAAQRQWISVSSANNAVTDTNQTTWGSQTMTQSSKVQIPSWANSIELARTCDALDGSAAASTITNRKLSSSGVKYGPHYIGGSVVAAQTTSGESTLNGTSEYEPSIAVIPGGGFFSAANMGAADAGNAVSFSSYLFSSLPPTAGPLRWLAAAGTGTTATDLLTTPLTAISGDTLFPYKVDADVLAISQMQLGFATGFEASGYNVGQFRLEGSALPVSPSQHDIGAMSVGGEAAATAVDARPVETIDRPLAVTANSSLDILAGYSGTDAGTQAYYMGIGFLVRAS